MYTHSIESLPVHNGARLAHPGEALSGLGHDPGFPVAYRNVGKSVVLCTYHLGFFGWSVFRVIGNMEALPRSRDLKSGASGWIDEIALAPPPDAPVVSAPLSHSLSQSAVSLQIRLPI